MLACTILSCVPSPPCSQVAFRMMEAGCNQSLNAAQHAWLEKDQSASEVPNAYSEEGIWDVKVESHIWSIAKYGHCPACGTQC